MAGGTYTCVLTTDKGAYIEQLSPLGFVATREISRIGYLKMQLPPSFDKSLLARDRMVQVKYTPYGGTEKLFRVYFVRYWKGTTTARGHKELTVEGPDTNDLLRRRVIAAYDGSDEAEISANECDSAMAELARDTYDDTIAPTPDAGTRDWSALFSVKGSAGTGPQLTRQFAFEPYLTRTGGGIFPELAKASKEAGDEIFFDIVPDSVSNSSISLQFRTYHNQPGQDVSNKVTLSLDNGGLQSASIEHDYRDEITYVYAGGKGREDDRNIQQVYDATRYGASFWNRCEAFQSSYEDSDNGAREEGRMLLVDGEPIIRFLGEAADCEAATFGKDWYFGDRISAEYEGITYDALVRAVTLTGDGDGRCGISARLDYEA